MELRQLEYVVAVAELKNFTRAAQRCHVAQSALSHQVARLERELGVRLFDRTSRSVAITPVGEAILSSARQALAAADKVRADAADRVRGTLRIGAIPTVTSIDLPTAIAFYRRTHPDVAVTLVGAGSDDLVAAVRSGDLDVGFIGVPVGFTASGVRSRLLGTEDMVAAVPVGHPLVTADRPSLADIAGADFVDLTAGSAARAQTDGAFHRADLDRTVVFEVGTVEFMLEFVARGLGVGMIPAGYRVGVEGIDLVRLRDSPVREQRVVSATRPSATAQALLRQLRLG